MLHYTFGLQEIFSMVKAKISNRPPPPLPYLQLFTTSCKLSKVHNGNMSEPDNAFEEEEKEDDQPYSCLQVDMLEW